MEKLDEINARFAKESKGVYPFMSKSRVTVLKKGFHQKKTAKYRGISMIRDKQSGQQKALLIGYFYVPKNYVIVPEGITITEGKRKLISDKINKGFEVTTSFPSLKPFEFEEGSEEYEVAKIVNENYKQEL